MTIEDFQKANEIVDKLSILGKQITTYQTRIGRIKEYIKVAKKTTSMEFAGKEYKTIELKFNVTNPPTNVYVDDMFDLVGENREDFFAFLKKTISNYEKKIKDNEKEIVELQSQFDLLGNKEEKVA